MHTSVYIYIIDIINLSVYIKISKYTEELSNLETRRLGPHGTQDFFLLHTSLSVVTLQLSYLFLIITLNLGVCLCEQ